MYKNLAATLVVACFFTPLSFAQSTPGAPPVKAGFVYVSPITEAGWTKQHDEGRKAVVAKYGDRVETTFVEKVSEGPDAERVMLSNLLKFGELRLKEVMVPRAAIIAVCAPRPRCSGNV